MKIDNTNKKLHKEPSPKDLIKNHLPINEMKNPIINFCKEQTQMFVSHNNNTEFPSLEVVEYRYTSDSHLIILTPASMFLNTFDEGSKFSGFIFPKDGHGLKMTKRIYGNFMCKGLPADSDFIKDLAQTDNFIKKMSTHGAKFFILDPLSLTAFFGGNEIFSLDKDMTPHFAEYAPNGKKRYENSRHVLMEYQEREVVFNTLIEGNTYYTLTKENSNKIDYIKTGGECQFYDGRDNHFKSKVEILEDKDIIQDIFQKLVDTNHSYFKDTQGLVALKYKKN